MTQKIAAAQVAAVAFLAPLVAAVVVTTVDIASLTGKKLQMTVEQEV